MARKSFQHEIRILLIIVVVGFTVILNTMKYFSPVQSQHFSAFLNKSSFIVDFLERSRTVQCTSAPPQFDIEQRGNYFILKDFVAGSGHFECHATITFTAPADYTFLDNLLPLVQHWQGPISVAVYAPGGDFHVTLRTIAHLRHCYNNTSRLIKQWVTFHIFFHNEHIARMGSNSSILKSFIDAADCEQEAPFDAIPPNGTYRKEKSLLFPINVARNIARQAARTHYVFAADIELYPSENFIRKFMDMLRREPQLSRAHPPRVFALPIFELKESARVPSNKTQLLEMYREKEAMLFHQRICSICHRTPNFTQWLNASETKQLSVFAKGKRVGPYRMWEAFYIGTKKDPLFDERLSWEGQGNKMSQGFAMCLLDYDYLVLNNAFIVHKPGVKKSKEQVRKFKLMIQRTNRLLKAQIKPQLIRFYGNRKGCVL